MGLSRVDVLAVGVHASPRLLRPQGRRGEVHVDPRDLPHHDRDVNLLLVDWWGGVRPGVLVGVGLRVHAHVRVWGVDVGAGRGGGRDWPVLGGMGGAGMRPTRLGM